MINDVIRGRIITLRKQKGLTQESLAEKLGMCLRNYKRLKSGQKKIIDLELVESIAEALHEPLTAFFASGEETSGAPKK